MLAATDLTTTQQGCICMTSNELKTQCQQLLASCDALFLATTDSNNTPMASYAPCWRDAAGFLYVMLSDLAEHTANLRNSKEASCLVLGSSVDDAFARPRVTLKLQAEFLKPNNVRYQSAIDGLTDKHGETMDTLQQLSDFHLICMKPVSGMLVSGFATTLQLSRENTPDLIPA